ncbi:MAG: hypothetical protein NVS4B11_16050 [Ktedonobacteraceae bacterium]
MESQAEISETSQEPSIVQERLNWKLACRDDVKVQELSDAGFLDEFFVFLEALGMMQAFEQMRLPACSFSAIKISSCRSIQWGSPSPLSNMPIKGAKGSCAGL